MIENAATQTYEPYEGLLHPQLRGRLALDAVQEAIFNDTEANVYRFTVTNANGQTVWQRDLPLSAGVDADMFR